MGNVSYHFNKKDFACKCGECKGEFKMSLTLIGILESLMAEMDGKVRILKGYICYKAADKLTLSKKNYHKLGRAADIHVPEESFTKAFRYLEQQPEIRGLGFDEKTKMIRVDVRERDKEVYLYVIKENDYDVELTEALRSRYDLGEPVEKTKLPEPVTVDIDPYQ